MGLNSIEGNNYIYLKCHILVKTSSIVQLEAIILFLGRVTLPF